MSPDAGLIDPSGQSLSGDMSEMADSATTSNSSLEIVSDIIENPGVRYTMVALYVVAILVASLGNGFLIVFISRHWKQTHRNVTAILILNLAACDFINVVLQQPMKLVDILVYHEQNETYCQVSGFFSAFFSGVAFMCMVAIAQERFLLICHPFKAKRFLTMRNTVIVEISIWVGVAIFALPLPLSFVCVQSIHLESGVATFCLLDFVTDKNVNSDVYVSIIFVMFFLVPLVIILLSYISIFRDLYRTLPGHKQPNEAALKILQQRRSLAKVMLSVAVVFVVSNGPKWILFLIGISDHDIENNAIFAMLFVDLLSMISPMMNPIVYSIRFRTLRKGITHGGSIYNALKHLSLNRQSSGLTVRSENNAMPSASNSYRAADLSEMDTDRELTPITEEPLALSNGNYEERFPLSVCNGSSTSVQSDSV